jgi:hypothetical protein
VWWQAEYGTTTKEAFDTQTRPPLLSGLFTKAFADTSTFYPDDSEVTSVDGRVRATGASWSAAHDATSGDQARTYDTNDNCISATKIDSTYWINRGFFLFDTSAIDDGHTIDSATFSVYQTHIRNDDNDGEDFVSVVTTTPASNTDLVVGDVDQIGTTEQHDSGQRKDITSIFNDAYLHWTLNSTGLGNISKTGVTKFGLREGP